MKFKAGDRIEKCFAVPHSPPTTEDGPDAMKAWQTNQGGLVWKRGTFRAYDRSSVNVVWVWIDGRSHAESANINHIRPLPVLDRLAEQL